MIKLNIRHVSWAGFFQGDLRQTGREKCNILIGRKAFHFLAYFLYFEKNKTRLKRSPCSLSAYPSVSLSAYASISVHLSAYSPKMFRLLKIMRLVRTPCCVSMYPQIFLGGTLDHLAACVFARLP
jgi:hypothetical protein